MIDVSEITDLDQWDDFVEASEQGTIFSTTKWLKLFDQPFKIYGCFRQDELVGGITGFVDQDKFSSFWALTPFQGILTKTIPGMKYPSILSLHNEIADILIQHLRLSYQELVISNHYTFPDIRPFLWHEYQSSVKYTYVVDMSNKNDAWQRMEKDTRVEVKKAEFNGVHISASENIEKFNYLYSQTFERKGLPRPVSAQLIERLCKNLSAELYLCDTAGVIFINDSKRAYYILGASSNPGDGASSFCLWYALCSTTAKEVDLVGANDQKIQLFKRGFGGVLKPYYAVTGV